MNWYKHYIGDFQRDTGHLTLMEVGAYRALIDHYYSTEQPLPMKKQTLYRICRAHSTQEQAAVMVAIEFFAEFEGHYHHKRIDEEIQKTEALGRANRIIALQREADKRFRREHEALHGSTTNRARSVAPEQHLQTPDLKAEKRLGKNGVNS